MAEKYAYTHSSAAPPRLRRLRGSSCVGPSPPRPRRHVLALARAYSLARQGRHRSQRAAAAVRVCRGEPLAVRVARRCACRAICRAADTGMRPRCSTPSRLPPIPTQAGQVRAPEPRRVYSHCVRACARCGCRASLARAQERESARERETSQPRASSPAPLSRSFVTGVGFLMLGALGFVVKLVHIPINNLLVGGS